MYYSPHLMSMLQSIDAAEGDTIRISGDGRDISGVLQPSGEFSHPDVLVVKMDSGYDVGVRITPSMNVNIIAKGEVKTIPSRVPSKGKGLPRVAILGTGGTISSYADQRTGAVHPALSAEDLLNTVPEIADICDVNAEAVFSIFSENMSVDNWQQLAEVTADYLNSGIDGVIILHGTDTMSYTAAALSFMLGDIPKPVIITGAQRSSDRPSSDAYINLYSAAQFILSSDAAEVLVLMHDSPSDTSVAVHRATKVRKMHTSRRDAFQSINISPIAKLGSEGDIAYLESYNQKSNVRVSPRLGMEKDVAFIQYYPGMSPTIFENIIAKNKGVVISGTGLGHVNSELIKPMRKAIESGTVIVMTSQCLSGSVNLNVYSTGRDLLSTGVISGEDMLPETAYVKLMWALGQTDDVVEVRKIMASNLRGELSDRRLMQ